MMKKRLSKILIGLIVLVLGALGFSACAKSGVGGRDEQSTGIPVGNVTIIEPMESADGLIVAWIPPNGAERYDFTCNNFHTVIEKKYRINLMTESTCDLVAGQNLNIKVIAKAKDRPDSEPAELTYTIKGVELNSPANVSLNNEKIKWEGNTSNDKFLVKINGEPFNGTDGYTTATELDISEYIGRQSIEISVVGDGKFLKSSESVTFEVNADHSRMVMPQVKNYKIKDNVLSWDPIGGAAGYRVMDLYYNIRTIEDNFIDLSDRNLVRGVYALSSQPEIDHAEIIETEMPYLTTGKGTVSDPYIITTPFELRAIDYYEAKYEELYKEGKRPTRNNYKIANDLDYSAVIALEDASNIYTLAKAFYGTLDGNGKTLKGVRVVYDGGYWSLFDYLVAGSTVKNMTFDSPKITNGLQMPNKPIGAKIATIADRNYGTISGITVNSAEYTAAGGEVSGICSHNYGTISNCTVSGRFIQADTELYGQACYEMAGIVLENNNGGVVSGNKVTTLTIQGSIAIWGSYDGDHNFTKGGEYNNVRTAAGICAVNRAGGIVSNNSYGTVDLRVMEASGQFEFGGIVAYNAGTVTIGSGTLGNFYFSTTTAQGDAVAKELGAYPAYGVDPSPNDLCGTKVGKSDGTVN